MAQKIDLVVSADVTDWRDFSSVLNAEPRVSHAWTLIRSRSRVDPVDGFPEIAARKGGVPLKANVPVIDWIERGRHEVTDFSLDKPKGERFSAVIPFPARVFSVLLNVRLSQGNTVAWGINTNDGGMWYSPKRGGNNRILGLAQQIHLGQVQSGIEWTFDAVVIDQEKSEAAASSNFGEWTSMSTSGFAFQRQDTAVIWVGQGSPTRPGADGSISDLAIVEGDLRTMGNLMGAWNAYNKTGYAR